jgi:hypothetical protein
LITTQIDAEPNKLYRRDIICEAFVKKYIAFPFVFPSIFRRSTLGRRLLLARTLPLPKLPALGNEKKN